MIVTRHRFVSRISAARHVLITASTLFSCNQASDRKQASETIIIHPPSSPSPESALVHYDANIGFDRKTTTQVSDTDLIDIRAVAPTILLDIRYASTNNFVGKSIYPTSRCLLRRPVAHAIARVQNRLKHVGLQLVIWDCYRPFGIQEQFWKLRPDPRYVAQPIRLHGAPHKGSKHNRGAAVDLSLADANGLTLPMPTDYDEFSPRAHRGAKKGISLDARQNSEQLSVAMITEGFEGISTEWWHFDHNRWREFPLSDHSLTK